jgi:MFS family permease
LFTGRDVILAILAGILLSVGQGAFFYQFATFNYEVQQTGPVQAALRIIPFVLGLLVASFMIARLALRFGARRLIVGGMGLMVIGFIWFSFVQINTPFWFLVIPVTCIGFGFGVAVPARTQIVLSAPPTHLLGSAAAVNAAAGQSGYALGVALSSAMVTQLADFHFIRLLEQAGVSPAVIDRVKEALPSLAARTIAADYPNVPEFISNLVTIAYEAAFTTGMTQMFLIMGIGLAIAAAAIYLFMSRGLRATIAPPVNQISLDS